MEYTSLIKCPICDCTQEDDIYELTEGVDFEGEFKLKCDECVSYFTVSFEFVPKIKTL